MSPLLHYSTPLPPPLTSPQTRLNTDVVFAPLLSRLHRPGQDPVGMRGIPTVTLVVFTRGENKSSARSLGLTSNRLTLLSSPFFSAEVQDPRPANEALPHRAPAQAAALRQQPAHRERPPLHEGGLAGRAVSASSAACVEPADWPVGEKSVLSSLGKFRGTVLCRTKQTSILRSRSIQ